MFVDFLLVFLGIRNDHSFCIILKKSPIFNEVKMNFGPMFVGVSASMPPYLKGLIFS